MSRIIAGETEMARIAMQWVSTFVRYKKKDAKAALADVLR
jgi:hypothetical protein